MPTLPLQEFALRQLIGVVHVVDCAPLEQAKADPSAEGPRRWVLARPRAIRQAD